MNTMIWVPSPTEAWIPASVDSLGKDSINVRLRNQNEIMQIPGPMSIYDTLSPESLEEECDNLVDLESYNEGIILHHIKKRFSKGSIYTYVGNILVAVNPYKSINIYGLDVMEHSLNQVKRNENLPPHVYSIAAQALFKMREECKDQCCLISGESGAGKTEATKKILQFISTMSKGSTSRAGVNVESQILDSNPILESFGNAKTIRNNNSSRFGKYMEINFDKKLNIKGCNITAYLLEKTRVVKLSPQERNYHIFYMLLEGGSREQRQELSLKPADQFYYLSQGGCVEIDRRSDKQEFAELISALENLRIQNVKEIFQCVAAILHIGNLQFSPSKKTEGGCQISSGPTDCKRIAQLLGLLNASADADALDSSLCFRENIVNNEVFLIPLDVSKSTDQRDALAKYIYGKLFDLIVSNVNTSLFRGRDASGGTNIGVLDIFGFEVFKDNSFEQLCINYCNERLQTFFNEIIFEGEMKMYAADGVNCDDISYQDNLGCIRLIDLKGASIFALLDEEVIIPQGSEDKLVAKLHQTFDESPTSRSAFYVRNRKQPRDFGVRHFAGDVIYNITNFLEKNKDALATGLIKLINLSSMPLLHSTTTYSNTASPDPIPPTPARGGNSNNNNNKSNKMTLSAKFKLDLDQLMNTLRTTSPHFIRCVKPNEFQMPDRFEPNLTLNQLKYSGLFEAIRIRKAGYAVRLPHALFISRYAHITKDPIPKHHRGNPHQHVQALLSALLPLIDFKEVYASKSSKGGKPVNTRKSISTTANGSSNQASLTQYCIGNTRVYIRSQQLKLYLDTLRTKFAGNRVHHIQRLIRGYLCRKRVFSLIMKVQDQRIKDRKTAKVEIELMAEEDKLSLAQEDIVRGDIELQNRIREEKKTRIKAENDRKKKVLFDSAARIQKIVRGFITRTRCRRTMCEVSLERALNSRKIEVLRRAIDLPKKYNTNSKLIRTYQQYAKNLLLDILNESYVENQLQDAIATLNTDMLTAAIKLAEDSNMPYIKNLQTAKSFLVNQLQSRSILVILSTEMSACTTIPKLLARIDYIQPLIKGALDMGLGGEYEIQNAVMRVGKIKNLVTVRNEIRKAVELCSKTRMETAMMERNKQARIFGPELCSEEVVAVFGMVRMSLYESQISSEYRTDTILFDKKGEDGRDDNPADDSNDSPQDDTMQSSTGQSQGLDGIDIRLPPFVRGVLENMRDAKSLEEFNEAVHELVTLVPNESERRAYVRVYKWVVAFATWRYTKTAEEEAMHERHMKLIDIHEQRNLEQERVNTSMRSMSMCCGPMKKPLAIPITNAATMSTIDNKSKVKTMVSPMTGRKINISSGTQRKHGYGYKAENDELARRVGLASQMSPGFSFGNSHEAFSPPSRILNFGQLSSGTANVSPVKSSPIKSKLKSPDKTSTGMGKNSNTPTGRSPNKFSPKKSSTTESNTLSRNFNGYGDNDDQDAGGQQTFIPFSQRQSKTTVTINEAIKIGKQMTIKNADEMIEHALKEYQDFYEKNKYEARWRV